MSSTPRSPRGRPPKKPLQASPATSSRSKRKRTAKNFGDDFLTPMKRKVEDVEEDEIVSSPSPKKRKGIVQKEILVTDEQGDRKIIDTRKEKENAESTENAELVSGDDVSMSESAGKNVTELEEQLGETVDDEECEETFGKPCYVSENKCAELAYVQALEILQHQHHKTCISRTNNPVPGEAYLFDTSVVMKLWQDDGYHWQRIVRGKKIEITSEDSSIVILLSIDLAQSPGKNSSLSRFVYRLESRKNIILVYYKENKEYVEDESTTTEGRDVSDVEDLSQEDLDALEDKAELATYFDYRDALDLLDDSDGKLSTEPPVYPKGGEVYFYDTNEVGEMWKFDSYVWRNCGCRRTPSKNPQIIKMFFLIRIKGSDRDGSSSFRRIVYRSIARPNIIMVHYSGDETVFVPRPHGNSKTAGNTYTPSPSRLHSLSRISSAAMKGVKIAPSVGRKKATNSQKESVPVVKIENDPGNSSVDDSLDNSVRLDPNASAKKQQKRIKPLLIMKGDDILAFDLVITMLQEHADEANTRVVQFPKAGEAYVYNVAKIGKKWRQDGYLWADQRSTSYYPRHKPIIVRRIHCVASETERRGSKVFQRCTFHLIDNPRIVLMQYIGDHEAAGRPVDYDLGQEEDNEEHYVDLNETAEASMETTDVASQQKTENHEDVACPPETEETPQKTGEEAEQQHSDEYVTMKLQMLSQQKKNLELQETKLLLEIKNLKEEKQKFYEQYGSY